MTCRRVKMSLGILRFRGPAHAADDEDALRTQYASHFAQAAISALAYEAVKTTSVENQIEETIGEERHRTHIAVVKFPGHVLLREPLTGPIDSYVGYVDTVDFKALLPSDRMMTLRFRSRAQAFALRGLATAV
jgi:hypothetical protein